MDRATASGAAASKAAGGEAVTGSTANMGDDRARRGVPALALWLLILPALLVGPSLLPGRAFLPLLPAALPPLALEDPAAGDAARERANWLTSDALLPFWTDALSERAAVRAGALPTWDPLLGLGEPLAAGSLVGAWYPPNWLHHLLPPHVAFGWLAVLHLALAGWGMARFLRARGFTAGAQLLGALAIQASGFGVLHLHLGMKIAAAVWLPWCLEASEGLLRGERRAGLRLALYSALSFLAGFPPIAVFVLLTTAVYGAARAAATARSATLRSRASRSALVPRLAAWLGLGVLGASVALLPTWEALQLSPRTPVDAATVAAQALPRAASSTALLPGLFGLPTDAFFAPRNPLAWWLTGVEESQKAMQSNALEWSVHAGLAILLLALSGIVAAPKRALLPTLLLAGVLGFAFGIPPLSWLYALPGLNLGAPGRVLAVGWVLWPWLAAIGLECLVRRKTPALIMALIVGLGGVGLGAGLWKGVDPDTFPARLEQSLARRHDKTIEEVREFVPPETARLAAARLRSEGRWLALLALGAALAATGTRLSGRRRLEGMGPTVTLVALAPWLILMGIEGVRLGRTSLAPRHLEGALLPHSPALDAVRKAADGGRVLRVDRSLSGVAEVQRLFRPNLLSAYGVADLTPYVVFPSADLVAAMGELDQKSRYRSGVSRLSDPALLDAPILDVLRVSCVLATEPLDHPRLEHTFGIEGFHVYRRIPGPGGMPEARVHPAPAEPDDAPQADLMFPPLTPPGSLPPDWHPGQIEVLRPSPTRLDVQVLDSSGGWLVMYDRWYPDWKVTVNGTDAEMRRAQGVARAVRIPAGTSLVRTKYEPWSLRYGAALSLLAVLVAVVAARKRP